MKTLRQSLIDYEMALLEAIADCRAVPLTTSNQVEAVNHLVQNLLTPVAVALAVDDLTEAEQEALQALLEHGGQVEVPRFARKFGTIRPVGSARLERERPWQNPANPAEGLWYRGLIFKAFQASEQGSHEIFYIPDDLLPLLKPVLPRAHSASTLQITQTADPEVTISAEGRLRENFFSLLVYLQTTPIRLQGKSELPPKARQTLAECLLPPLLATFQPADELDFLLHMGLRADLLTIAHGRLRPDRDAIRTWLQSEPIQQAQLLQQAWRTDPTWNDLRHVPGLVSQPTGWENSPLRARSKILGYLEQISAAGGEWLSIDDFISTIKHIDPDFQRPSGDYESWYIKDSQGNFLMGFEHWDEIEGGLIRYLLTHILLLLGVVDVGSTTDTAPPDSFRLTALGEAFLANRAFDSATPKRPAYFRIDNNFRVRVPAQASLYDRFQLARFAELDHRNTKGVVYHITQASVSRAIKNGVKPDQIIAFLTRVTNKRIPLQIVETTRTWGTRHATVQIEQATVLRLKDKRLVKELNQHPELSLLLGETLGPNTIVVPAENVAEVRRLLAELGYLG